MSAPRSLVVVVFAASGCLFADPGPAAIDAETDPGTTTGPMGTTGPDMPTTEPATPTTGEPFEPCAWEQRAPMMAPPARIDATLTLDEMTGRLVLFGGRAGLAGADLGDTWEFDGAGWHPFKEEQGPGPRRGHAAAWDHERKRVVMFGGEYGSFDTKLAVGTWVLEGSKWKRIGDDGGDDDDEDEGEVAPSLRAYAAMADLPALRQVVMFGGRTGTGLSDQTWTWDGMKWKEVVLTLAPSPRFDHSMALDETSGKLLLHGGCGSTLCAEPLTDTWAFDGAAWTLLASGHSPGPRGGGMVHDRSQPAQLRFAEGEGYRWDGALWGTAGAAPQALGGFALAYHPGTEGVVLFGGLTPMFVQSGDTWVFRCAR